MVRIAPDGNPSDRQAVRDSKTGKMPKCEECAKEATIWIRLKGDLYLCDTHAFHLARILMMDIGHANVSH